MGRDGASSSTSLLEFIETRLGSLKEHPDGAIFRVPRILRQVDPSAYEPMFVSIGPYHYKPSLHHDHHVSIDIDKENRPKLQQGQDLKWHFFQDFLKRNEKVPLADYVSLIQKLESKAKMCYVEDVSFDSDVDFNHVMLLDGCFILEFFIREIHGGQSNQNYYQHGNNMRLCWVYEDLLLLENQLPLFILEEIYDLFRTSAGQYDRFPHSLDYLVLETFKSFLDISFGENQEQLQRRMESEGVMRSSNGYHHLVHLVHDHLIRPPDRPTSDGTSNYDVRIDRSASTLQAMGVKIVRPTERTSLFDIKFDNGTLQLPHLNVTDSTSQLLRNFIAFEQTSESVDHYFSPYAFFMDDLINTVRDVDTLETCGVLTSHIGSNKNVVNLINKIGLGCIEDKNKNYLHGIQTRLEDYCKIRCHKWRAKLVDDYFGNPWSILSLLAAITLLILTALQTIFTILP